MAWYTDVDSHVHNYAQVREQGGKWVAYIQMAFLHLCVVGSVLLVLPARSSDACFELL